MISEEKRLCTDMALTMAGDTIKSIYSEHTNGKALSDVDIDKVLDAVKIIDILGRNGVTHDRQNI